MCVKIRIAQTLVPPVLGVYPHGCLQTGSTNRWCAALCRRAHCSCVSERNSAPLVSAALFTESLPKCFSVSVSPETLCEWACLFASEFPWARDLCETVARAHSWREVTPSRHFLWAFDGHGGSWLLCRQPQCMEASFYGNRPD